MKASKAVFLVFLSILSLCIVSVQPVKSQFLGSVYIKADGSVVGTDRIQRNGNLYTLTGNISGGIQVQKSYIVIDGAGYTVQGNGEGRGIDLSNNRGQDPSRTQINNVTLKNLRIVNFGPGIDNTNTNNNTFIGNHIANCEVGIWVVGSSGNTIMYNTIKDNVNGISICYSGGNNVITQNNMINNGVKSNNVIIVWLSPQPIVDRNYWSDYNGTDDDGDGIGDTPYVFINTDYAKYKDYHPLMEPVNTQPVWAAENSWATKASMPTARTSLGVAVVNGKIYAIGGYGNGYLNINEEYDPATNTWTTKKSMPTARTSFGIAAYQNKIYVIGGVIGFDSAKGESITCALNEVYDPLTDTWETKTPMPTNRSQLNANVVNGKIYLIGGRTGGQYSTVSLNEVYDPLTDSWTTKASIPYPVVQYASAVVDNKIYVIGGQDEFHDPVNLDLNQIYDPETDTWSFGAPIPTVVWQVAAGATTGILAPKRIYVIGGMPDKSIDGVNLNQAYNPESNTWSTGAPMPTARCNLAVAVVNDMLYAIGGVPGFMIFPFNTENEQYTPFGFGTVPPPDTTSPTVSIVSPENKTYTVNNVSLTFTVSEATLWIGYSLDGQANVTILGNTTLSGLSDGSHSLTVYARGYAGKIGTSETIYFSIKTQQSEPFPIIWIVAAIVIIAVVGAAILVYFVKVKKTAGKAE